MTKYIEILIVTWLSVTLFGVNSKHKSPLITEYRWKYFEYLWESPAQKVFYEENGLYCADPRILVPIDVDRSKDNRTFVTVIGKIRAPATLNTISDVYGESGPLLKPYPDWSWYNINNPCSGILNVFRVAIDDCNRLWVLDTGKINNNFVCPAKLLVFNLATDELIFSETIDNDLAINLYSGRGLLVNLIVETEGPQCEDTAVFIADPQGRALIVWRKVKVVRLMNEDIFGPQPTHSRYTIAGESFDLDDGLIGMALSPKGGYRGGRQLIFRPMSSLSFFKADISQLKTSYGDVLTEKMINVIPSQASVQAISSDGILFYGLTTETAIGCWNIYKPLTFKTATSDHHRLQFTSGMKVIKYVHKNFEEEHLLVMTNKIQKFYNNSTNINEYNFHILRAPVQHLIDVGGCDKKSHGKRL